MFRNPQRQIIFEHSEAPLLVLVGEDDGLMELFSEYSKFAVNRALKAGKTNISLLKFPKTGHLIDLPHCPHVAEGKTPLLPPTETTKFGGKSQPHALAQFQAWDTLLQFFKDKL